MVLYKGHACPVPPIRHPAPVPDSNNPRRQGMIAFRFVRVDFDKQIKSRCFCSRCCGQSETSAAQQALGFRNQQASAAARMTRRLLSLRVSPVRVGLSVCGLGLFLILPLLLLTSSWHWKASVGESGLGSFWRSADTPKNANRAGEFHQPFVHAPLDTEFIDTNFDRLKMAMSRSPSGKYQGQVASLMTRRRLDLNTEGWIFHTPSGRNLTLAGLQAETYDRNHSVPNLAHYILPFKNPQLAFHHYVCILSGFWVMRPQKVVFWYVNQPFGTYWELLRKNMTAEEWERRVIMIQRPVTQTVYNMTVNLKEHQADVMRIEAILLLGGVYFDLDVITLRAMEPLRKYQFAIGKELPTVLCNGVFLGAPNNTVLAMWHLAYQIFDDNSWGGHSLYVIGDICKHFPGKCRMEEESLDRPGWIGYGQVYGNGDRTWDWQARNYAMHLFYRLYGENHDLTSIRTLNNTLGDMFRFVLFGRKEPFKS